MNYFVIGFEGSPTSATRVMWGEALVGNAIKQFLDPISGIWVDRGVAERLAAEGHVTLFKNPVPLGDVPAVGARAIAYSVQKGWTHARLFAVSGDQMGDSPRRPKRTAWDSVVFLSKARFDRFRFAVLEKVAAAALDAADSNTEGASEIVSAGLVLDRAHSELNALRVYLAAPERRANAKRFAEAGMDEFSAYRFRRYLSGLLAEPEDTWDIKYRGGIAADEGMDLRAANSTFDALLDAHPYLVDELVADYPSLAGRSVPTPRFRDAEAASARFRFALTVRSATLAERVSRYLELELLERCLSGRMPERLQTNVALRTALSRVAKPTPETGVEFKPIGEPNKDALRPVSLAENHAPAVISTEDLRLFGILVGVINDARRAELLIGNPVFRSRSRISFSTLLPAEGGGEQRISFLEGDEEFWYRPVYTSVRREVLSNGRDRFTLLDAELLRAGTSTEIDTVPSTLLPGAFLTGLRLRLEHCADGQLVTPLGSVALGEPSRVAANTVMAAFSAFVKAHEVANAGGEGIRWSAPASQAGISERDRVLLALEALGGSTTLVGLGERVSADLGQLVPLSTVRRTVQLASDVMVVLEATISISDEGRAVLAAGRQMGLFPLS
jgi:hypothetical protein